MPALASFIVLVLVVFLIHAPAAKFASPRQRILLPPGSLLRDAFLVRTRFSA
jgi:hypothetical protein